MVTLPIRLLAIDLDGTLVNHQFQISPADLAAVRRAHEAGVEVVVATGRRHRFAMPMSDQLGFDHWLISSNGAITRSSKGEDFHRDLLPTETARHLCRAMQEFRGNIVLTFDTDEKGALALERLDELTTVIQKWLEKNLKYIEFVIPVENCLGRNGDPVQAMFCGHVPRMRQALEALAAAGLEDRVTILRTEYPERDLSIVDVLNRGCSKGHALERWARYRNIPREQVMAIGDNFNDIEMLEFAGQPFIMGNASQELRERGWSVTTSNAEHGVASAIEQVMGWIPAKV
jgi:Cof subfamily protein (haloacid dehalogenase superfamily)